MQRMHRLISLFLVVFSVTGAGPARAGASEAAWILDVEDRRDGSDPRLATAMRTGGVATRARVALALGRIGSGEAVSLLMDHLGSEGDETVRANLAFALGLAKSARAVKLLGKSLRKDGSAAVRARAAEALGLIGDKAALGSLHGALGTEKDDRVLEGVLVALFRLGDDSSVTEITPVSRRKGPVRARAMWCLGRLARVESLDRLMEGAQEGDPWVRKWSARGLSLLLPKLQAAGKEEGVASAPAGLAGAAALAARDRVAAKLRRLARDRERAVRLVALAGLGSAPASDEVRGVLLAATREKDPAIVNEAVRALGSHPHPDSRERLVELSSGEGETSRIAAIALGKQPRAGAALAGFHGELAGEDVLGHLDWLKGLEAEGGEASRARLGRIARGIDAREKSPVARAQAASSFVALATLRDRGVLRELFEDPDPFIRAPAAQKLLELKDVTMITPIVERAVAARGLDERDFKTAVIDGLAAIEEPGKSAHLKAFLEDEDRVVRLKAQAGLDGKGQAGAADRASSMGVEPGRQRRALRLARRDPVAEIQTNRGIFHITLFPVDAPLTVESFVSLAGRGFFDGQLIPRVVPDFVVQMGDPRGDWSGGPGYALRCEVTALPYERGTVGMALSGKDTGGSQFFVALSRQPHLDAGYSVFGRVTDGMDVVEKLQRGDRIVRVRVK